MCMSSPQPAPVTKTVAPPPAETPQPLASPYGDDPAMNLSQLRIGTRSNLKMRNPAVANAVSSSVIGPTGGSSGGGSSGGSSLVIGNTTGGGGRSDRVPVTRQV